MKLSAILSCVAAQQFSPGQFMPQPAAPAAGGLFGGAGGMNSILPLLLLGDGLGGSDDLLPLLLLGGGLGGGAGGAGDMSSILPLLLLGDDDITDSKMTKICDAVDDSTKKAACIAAKDAAIAAHGTCTKSADDCTKDKQSAFESAKKEYGKKNKLTDLLLLTSLAGPGGLGGAGGMSSILPLLLLGDGLGSSSSSSDDLLPLLLLGGGLGGGAVDPVTGQAGGMDPLMMMLLLD